MAEGINSKIMAIKYRVGGYRNRENFKTAIYFYCGGLELYPQETWMDLIFTTIQKFRPDGRGEPSPRRK